MYYALTTYEEVSKRQNYGKIQFYPEVKDFFCPTCNRHFSSYDHCHRHAEIRNHNISSLFCKYSYKGLPKCRRSSPFDILKDNYVQTIRRRSFIWFVLFSRKKANNGSILDFLYLIYRISIGLLHMILILVKINNNLSFMVFVMVIVVQMPLNIQQVKLKRYLLLYHDLSSF